ncbi:partitioning defective 3 homolog [Uloborus diversus]|uniref:partitioning defective 3 homolog n=1 Tax=Uloborus diversus TaxID=327109 RepID=UPI00240A5E4C|nr:partitioning defective 3 homolog [Uloborus diversus]
MKVTVYFGNVRVIVPCGKGDILVRELMELAITRYKKATRKCPSSVVTIHNLKSSRDDGILYPDDRLDDVADDREQIIAVFEENGRPPSPLGEPRSESSLCTGSPDLFSVEVGSHYNPSDGEATDEQGPAMLQVRRGSEPALNCLFPPVDLNKRWSTAVVINATPDLNGNGPAEEEEESGSFLRGSGRLSVLGGDAETSRWVEAADRQLMKDFNENFTLKVCNGNGAEESDSSGDEREKTIILKNESGPLGIHVVPDYDGRGRDTGLVIQGIESGGRIDRDGRFRVGDRITRINGKSLREVSFQTAQEVFKDALRASRIRLELVRGAGPRAAAAPRKPPPPVYPEGKREEDLVEGEERAGGTSTRVATVTPTKKVPASATRRLASANTRRIGRMITVQLTKGDSGLGFSITTRDNSAGGRSPIYVKNILPKGAAVEEGSLLPGDRLLEVNGIPMTGKSQAEAARVLRDIPPGESVRLVVSRQEAEEDPPENGAVACEEEEGAGVFPWKHREILTFRIPLEEAPSGGLGVSVKGKSTSAPGGSVDLGIFIKGIIPGGAADKDGRLSTDDQLVNVNGISLLGTSNTDAMETLRGAMSRSDGPIRNAVILTVARRASRPPSEVGGAPQGDLPPSLWDGTWNGTKDDPADIGVPPGRNPVLERLTGRDPEGDVRTCRLPQMVVTDTDEREAYCATGDAVIIEGEYDPRLKKVGPAPEGVAPASSQLSLAEDGGGEGFARDGFGRQSMSEKRHAQLDARSTDTYQRSKRAKEERQRQHAESDPERGPSLGLRKSSSLESLQTMMRELDREDEEARRRAAAQSSRGGARSRGCNESFRAAVDRSYDAPPPPSMETLDEESESGSSSGHLLTRSADLADHIDPLYVYGQVGKSSSKRKSLLKGLGSVFKFGKKGKSPQDPRGRSDEDEESHRSESRESDRAPSDVQGRRLPPVPRGEVEGFPPNRQERMQSLREQHQRMHQRRQGQYPLDHQEEYYENVLKEKEKYVPPYEVVHGRSRSLDVHDETSRVPDPGRYGHYVNYEEIRQHARRRAPPTVEGVAEAPRRPPPEAPRYDYGRAGLHENNRLYSRIIPGSKV